MIVSSISSPGAVSGMGYFLRADFRPWVTRLPSMVRTSSSWSRQIRLRFCQWVCPLFLILQVLSKRVLTETVLPCGMVTSLMKLMSSAASRVWWCLGRLASWLKLRDWK